MSSSIAPIKMVFDCMIFLQATKENSRAASALDLLDTGEINLYGRPLPGLRNPEGVAARCSRYTSPPPFVFNHQSHNPVGVGIYRD